MSVFGKINEIMNDIADSFAEIINDIAITVADKMEDASFVISKNIHLKDCSKCGNCRLKMYPFEDALVCTLGYDKERDCLLHKCRHKTNPH